MARSKSRWIVAGAALKYSCLISASVVIGSIVIP